MQSDARLDHEVTVAIQDVEKLPRATVISASPRPVAGESLSFDLDSYRARMVKYLGEPNGANHIFFDALEFAFELHTGQRRKSGAPYISHPCAVAEILARELHFRDPVLLAAALLHDVVEDVPSVEIEDLEARFGRLVAELVDGCTKLTRHHLDRATLSDLTHSKIFLSASRRLGVLIIKLADRLHNLRTLHYLPKAKRQRIAQETIEVYAPIAARFNIFPLKRELYHLALSYLYPRKSKKILQFIRDVRNAPEVAELEEALRKAFANGPCAVTIRPRAKGLGSYYNPLKRTIDLTNAENHVDIALILHSGDVLDCYSALGIVSTAFAPIPRSLRDFISTPKANGYRSLHVRIHVGGQNYLIKIRTPEMDQWALFGILNEWDAQKPLSDEHWNEVSELLRSIGEYGGAGPQRKALIRLSEAEEIFVYSPKGDIYYLPKGSVVLDFAYRIHSQIGDYCEGAFVNAEWASPTRVLKDGDTVEIFTASELLDVDPELEQLCKTPRARTLINRHLQHKRSQFAMHIGREILMQEIRRHGLPQDTLESETTPLILEFLNIKDLPELFSRLGQDLISPHLVLYYLESPRQEHARSHPQGELDVLPYERNTLEVPELDRAVHKFAKCCNPYPGQTGVVATLSERGTTFHRSDCRDVLNRHDLQPQRLLDIAWPTDTVWRHPLRFHLHIAGETVNSLLPALALMPPEAFIQQITSALDKHDQPVVQMRVRLKDFSQAKSFFEALDTRRFTIEHYERDGGYRAVK